MPILIGIAMLAVPTLLYGIALEIVKIMTTVYLIRFIALFSALMTIWLIVVAFGGAW